MHIFSQKFSPKTASARPNTTQSSTLTTTPPAPPHKKNHHQGHQMPPPAASLIPLRFLPRVPSTHRQASPYNPTPPFCSRRRSASRIPSPHHALESAAPPPPLRRQRLPSALSPSLREGSVRFGTAPTNIWSHQGALVSISLQGGQFLVQRQGGAMVPVLFVPACLCWIFDLLDIRIFNVRKFD